MACKFARSVDGDLDSNRPHGLEGCLLLTDASTDSGREERARGWGDSSRLTNVALQRK